MNRIERNELRKKKGCRHFTGIHHKQCEAGVKYPDVLQLPCRGEFPCDKYETFTSEELAEQEKEKQRHLNLMRQGLTSCCEAPFDTSQVIRSGRHKGHGPRFCSKCRKLVMYA